MTTGDRSAKAVVNELVASYLAAHDDGIGGAKSSHATLEQTLLDEEMRLHVQAESLNEEIVELREACSSSIPRAARQLTQMREEVGMLHVCIACAMKGLGVRVGGDEGGLVARTASGALGSALGSVGSVGSVGPLRRHSLDYGGQYPQLKNSISKYSYNNNHAACVKYDGHAADEIFAQLQQLHDQRALTLKASTILEEASNLTSLFKTIDSMLQRDDLPRLADTLARLRRGLEIVSADTVTRAQRNKVDQLEERVFDLAVAALDTALRMQQGEQCRRACGVLGQIGKAGLVPQHYVTIRSQPLVEVWEGFGKGVPYASWVGTFYEEVGRSVEGELGWCGVYLGEVGGGRGGKDGGRGLVVDMLMAFFGRVEVPCKARLAGATRGGLSAIEAMEQVVGCTGGFLETLVRLLGAGGEGGEEGDGRDGWDGWDGRVEELLRVVIRPYDDMLRNYASKEGAWLAEALEERVAARGLGSAGSAGSAEACEGVVDDACACVMESLQRCASTTQSTALPGLLSLLDGALVGLCERVIGQAAEVYSKGGSEGVLTSPEFLGGLLSLPRVVAKMQGSLVVDVEAQVRERVEELRDGLAAFKEAFAEGDTSRVSGSASLNYRRIARNAELARGIEDLVAKSAGGTPLLPKLRRVMERVDGEVESLITTTFVGIVDVHFRQLETGLRSLSAPEAGSSSPAAAAYPLQYMISAGEQLMLLPQLLEASLDLEDAESVSLSDDGDLVGTWLERLVGSVAEAYVKQLDGLHKLDASQCRQLSADCEYLCNVVNSLDCEVPVELMAWTAVLSAGDADGARALAESLETEQPTAARVAARVVAIRFGS